VAKVSAKARRKKGGVERAVSYRGVVRDGVVVLHGFDGPPEGTEVIERPLTARERQKDWPLPGFGSWKHRTDLGPTGAQAPRLLRRRVSSRGKAR
jgi:hypothetical protein